MPISDLDRGSDAELVSRIQTLKREIDTLAAQSPPLQKSSILLRLSGSRSSGDKKASSASKRILEEKTTQLRSLEARLVIPNIEQLSNALLEYL